MALLGQIIQILDTLEFSLSSHSLSFLLPAFWTFHHFWYLHWECVQGQPEGELILLFIAYSGTNKKSIGEEGSTTKVLAFSNIILSSPS